MGALTLTIEAHPHGMLALGTVDAIQNSLIEILANTSNRKQRARRNVSEYVF
jgi:hypothetical protein